MPGPSRRVDRDRCRRRECRRVGVAGGPSFDRLSQLREPSTGSAVKPAAHGEVRPRLSRRRVDGDRLTRRQCPDRARSPSRRRRPGPALRARDRRPSRATAASSGLPTSRLTRSALATIDGPRTRHAEVCVSRPAPILQRRRHPGPDDPQHPVPDLGGLRPILRSGRPPVRIPGLRPPRSGSTRPKSDGGARRDQRRRVGAEVPERGVGAPEQVPSARRRRRVHRRVRPGDRHRPSRHRQSAASPGAAGATADRARRGRRTPARTHRSHTDRASPEWIATTSSTVSPAAAATSAEIVPVVDHVENDLRIGPVRRRRSETDSRFREQQSSRRHRIERVGIGRTTTSTVSAPGTTSTTSGWSMSGATSRGVTSSARAPYRRTSTAQPQKA